MAVWDDYVRGICGVLRAVECTEKGGAIAADSALEQWARDAVKIRRQRGTIFLVGNGASAAMASHMAADLAKNAQLRTEVFSDLALITAISNDMGYEHVFSEPLARRGSRGDMLVAISSSGRSPNVLAAARVALDRQMALVTLSAMGADNPLRSLGTLNFYVPAERYGTAETSHAAILHCWMDMVAAVGLDRD